MCAYIFNPMSSRYQHCKWFHAFLFRTLNMVFSLSLSHVYTHVCYIYMHIQTYTFLSFTSLRTLTTVDNSVVNLSVKTALRCTDFNSLGYVPGCVVLEPMTTLVLVSRVCHLFYIMAVLINITTNKRCRRLPLSHILSHAFWHLSLWQQPGTEVAATP